MENLIKKADYVTLHKLAYNAFFAKITDKKQSFLDSHVDIKDYVSVHLNERLHEFTNGWTSYYAGSAKELQSYMNHETHQWFDINECEAFCKAVYDFTTNYELEIISEYAGDSSDQRIYNGTKFEADAIRAFRNANSHDLTKLSKTEYHNLSALIIYYSSRYMHRNEFDNLCDLQNLLVMFTGETYKESELKPWISWLESFSSDNVALSMADAEDFEYSDEYNDAYAEYHAKGMED